MLNSVQLKLLNRVNGKKKEVGSLNQASQELEKYLVTAQLSTYQQCSHV